MNRPTVARPGRVSHRELAILAVTWLGAAAYLFAFVPRGWVAGDEGMLGHCAERVLQGELPHVEFHDPYTGGLSLWHALAFRWLGIEVMSTRWFVYAAALLFVPVVFRLARRVVSPAGAAGVTLLAVVWSLPNYFSAMPSWYVLFLATGALLALVKHVETDRHGWLVPAGVLLGAAFLVKSTGLLFLAAALLFLVYREQDMDRGTTGSDPGASGPGVLAFRLFETLGLVAFIVVLAGFFSQRPGVMEIVHHVVPATALSLFLLLRVWRRPCGPAVVRFRRLTASGGLLLLGFFLPVAAFLAPYVRRGVLGTWIDAEVLFQPERLQYGVWSLPIPATLICALPLALLFAWPLMRPRRSPAADGAERVHRFGIGLAALGCAVLLSLGFDPYVYQSVWFALRPLVPILVLSGVFWLSTRAEGATSSAVSTQQRQTTFLILAVTAMASISQFPYARALYFCYIAPLVVLAWLFVADRLFQSRSARALHLVLGAFFGLFALAWLNLGWVETMDHGFRPSDHSVEPSLERAAGLLVTPGSARLYQDVVATIHEHSEPGDFILATPDAPEIYFFSNRRNPTGTFLDFLDEDFGSPARDRRLLELLERHQIDVVVLRRADVFTPLSTELIRDIERRFPGSRPVGPFSIHWRDIDRRPKPGGSPS